MERVDLPAGARVEAEMQVARRRAAADDVEVREARALVVLEKLADPERREHGLVEADARGEVARGHVDVVEDPQRPVPRLRAAHAAKATRTRRPAAAARSPAPAGPGRPAGGRPTAAPARPSPRAWMARR